MSCFETRARAELAHLYLDVASLNGAYLLPVGARLDLELNVGVSDSDLFESGWFGGVLVVPYGC